MQKLFTILGVVFIFILIIGGGVIGYAYYSGAQADKESKQYADTVIPKIAADWDIAVFDQYIDKARLGATDAQIAELFTVLKARIGSLKEYKQSTGNANVDFLLNSKTVITAKYLSKITSVNGDADINLLLLKEDGGWKIIGFHVHSPLLVNVSINSNAAPKPAAAAPAAPAETK